MSYQCLIVDDEDLARGLIASHIELLDGFEVVAKCRNAIEARKYLRSAKVDLIFLDIEMPILKGTDFVKTMKDLPAVIFTTAHRHFAIEAFELEAIDYLLKPITFERFFKATEKFLKTQLRPTSVKVSDVNQKEDYIFLRINRKQVKLLFPEVLYVESLKDYVKIHMVNDTHMVKYSISAFHKLLDDRFFRVHRSFIVNMNKVTAYTRHDLEIGNREIAIGEQYRQNVMKCFQE